MDSLLNKKLKYDFKECEDTDEQEHSFCLHEDCMKNFKLNCLKCVNKEHKEKNIINHISSFSDVKEVVK